MDFKRGAKVLPNRTLAEKPPHHDRRAALIKACSLAGIGVIAAAVPPAVHATEATGLQTTFTGGTNGALLFRDTATSDGANWLADVGRGSVLVSSGVGIPPAWSDSPSLKSLNYFGFAADYPYITLLERHDPTILGTVGDADGNVGGNTFGRMYQPVRFPNGPPSQPSYINDTWHWGLNVGSEYGGVGRADLTKPNLVLSFESKFYETERFGQEFHLQGVSADGNTAFRPFSVWVAHDASLIGATFQVDTFNVSDRVGNNLLFLSRENRSLHLVGSTMRFTANNVPAVQQMNKAGTVYLNVLYLDDGDVARIGTPLYVVGPRAGVGAVLPGVFAAFQPTTAQTNDSGLLVALPTISGNLYGVRAEGGATGRLTNTLVNTATGPNAHARSMIQVSGNGGGDPYIHFDVPAAQGYSVGIDNSDNDNLTISAASSLGANNLASFPASGGLRLPRVASDVPAPPASHGTIFMRSNGLGKTQCCLRFPSGGVQILATEQ